MAKKDRRRKLDPLAVETQEVISECHTKSIELVRITRLKYEANDYTFIDVRVFQRAYDDEGNEVYHPTRRGIHIKEGDFLKLIETFLQEKPKEGFSS